MRQAARSVRDLDARPVLTRGGVQWLGAACGLLFLAGTAGRALTKPLWHDEIFTLYLATAPSVGGLWNAIADGADLNPPLYHLAVRACAAIVGAGPLATRLPALLGFLAAGVALYVFTSRRLGASCGLVAALTPALTGVSLYAYEGRPYGLVLGFSAAALAAWQIRGERPSHRTAPVICALMLAGATFTHYYAVLMLLPLAAGEVTRVLIRRRVDGPMIVALAFALAPLVVLRPLIEGARRFAPTFWSRPAPGELVELYRQLLDPLSLLILAAGLCLTIAALWTHAAAIPGAPDPVGGNDARGDLAPDEIVAALALVALPVAGYALALFVTGAFHGRYVLQSVLGLGILLAWWSAALLRSRRDVAVLLGVLVLAFAARQASGAAGLVRDPPDPLAEHRLLLSGIPDDAPIVVSHALTFMPLVHYSNRESVTRFTYLTRPPDIVQQLGVDTGGRALRRLAEVVPLDVRDFDTFIDTHGRFFVYGPRSWLIQKLLSLGAEVRLLRDGDVGVLYEITLPR